MEEKEGMHRKQSSPYLGNSGKIKDPTKLKLT
jgi:hypothetical protein